MNGIQRRLPAFRALWTATGWWGPAWAAWTVVGFVVQSVVMAARPADQELRRNVNMVFALGLIVLMFQVMTRIREWQDAQTSPPTDDDAGETEEADRVGATKTG